MKRSGVADLPLHGGRVPAWLAERMVRLGTAISECVMYHDGTSEFLSRLSDPYWFQALGCVLGMDWHSSGITTSVVGALKRGLNPRASELGIYACGGRVGILEEPLMNCDPLPTGPALFEEGSEVGTNHRECDPDWRRQTITSGHPSN